MLLCTDYPEIHLCSHPRRLLRLSVDIGKSSEFLRHWGAGEGDALQVRFSLLFIENTGNMISIGYAQRICDAS